MSEAPFDPDLCRILWAAVFARAMTDAQTRIPRQPGRYSRRCYLRRQRKMRANITPYRRWAQARRLKIRKLEIQRDVAADWIEQSPDFGVCCELVDVDAEMMRLLLREEVAA